MRRILCALALGTTSTVFAVSDPVGTCMGGAFLSSSSHVRDHAADHCAGVATMGEAFCLEGAFRTSYAPIRDRARAFCAGIVEEGQGRCMAGAFTSGYAPIRDRARQFCE